jgi:hypothetical protein
MSASTLHLDRTISNSLNMEISDSPHGSIRKKSIVYTNVAVCSIKNDVPLICVGNNTYIRINPTKKKNNVACKIQ